MAWHNCCELFRGRLLLCARLIFSRFLRILPIFNTLFFCLSIMHSIYIMLPILLMRLLCFITMLSFTRLINSELCLHSMKFQTSSRNRGGGAILENLVVITRIYKKHTNLVSLLLTFQLMYFPCTSIQCINRAHIVHMKT